MALLVVLAIAMRLELGGRPAIAKDGEEFTLDFRLEECKPQTKEGNPYFILKPGYQLVLRGEDEGEKLRLVITVLKDQAIEIEGKGKVKVGVVEEREWVDGEIVEISKNFFIQCQHANDVYYVGEEVDIYEDGEVVSHEGAWQAGKEGALPGLIMPGTFLLGSRYFQEQAPGVALDRAENVAMGLHLEIPAGKFDRCVEVLETTPLEPGSESVKRYCPGIGLVFDDGVDLVKYGFGIFNLDNPEDN
jgi:hypothetical protein